MTRLIRSAVHLALLAAVAAAGCKYIPPKPAAFNNMIARSNEKLVEVAKKFSEAVEKLDAAAARGAANEADKLVNDLIKEYDGLSAPKHGSTFLAKYREFLKKQRQIVDECMKPAAAVLEGQGGNKKDRAEALMEKAKQIEQEAFRALDSAQSEFCAQKDYNFEPKQ